jgi:hypothetical protein
MYWKYLFRQHIKQLVAMVFLRHVSTHTSHRQVMFRTFLVLALLLLTFLKKTIPTTKPASHKPQQKEQ